MMGEINAVVEGCVQAGAEEIIVGEAHPVDLAELHPEAKLARGIPWQETPGLRDFDAVMFVGQHAMTGLAKAVRAHTGSSNSIIKFLINNQPSGELAYIGGLFGERDVPVVFLAGDSAACQEAEQLIPGVTTVAVEESFSVHAALCLPPAKTRPLLIEGAQNALKNIKQVKPIKFAAPITITMEFKYAQIADDYCLTPGSVRVDARTVSYTADTYYDTYVGSVAVLGSVLCKYDS
jgi:D-amino peptidase